MIRKTRASLWLSLVLMAICVMMLVRAIAQTANKEILLVRTPRIALPVYPGYPADLIQEPMVNTAHWANITHMLVLLGAIIVAAIAAILIRNAINGKLIKALSVRHSNIITAILCIMMPLKIFSDALQEDVESYLSVQRTGMLVLHSPDFVQVNWGMFFVIPLALTFSCLLHQTIKMQGDLEGVV
jgi:hypothetical protein